MKKYTQLEMEILKLDVSDIVATSLTGSGDENELPVLPFSKNNFN